MLLFNKLYFVVIENTIENKDKVTNILHLTSVFLIFTPLWKRGAWGQGLIKIWI